MGSDAEFVFDFGLSSSVVMLDSASTTDSRRIAALLPSVANPVAWGRQLLPGEIGAVGPIDIDPVATVPEPGTAAMGLLGGLALAGWLRRRRPG